MSIRIRTSAGCLATALVLLLGATATTSGRAETAEPAAAVLDATAFRLGEPTASRRPARQWNGGIVETRYVDEAGRRMAYLVRWHAPEAERSRVVWTDLAAAIRFVFDDVDPTVGETWRRGTVEYRLFALGTGGQRLDCAGFRRDDQPVEGTFGIYCRPGTEPMAPPEAERFERAVETGADPQTDDEAPPT